VRSLCETTQHALSFEAHLVERAHWRRVARELNPYTHLLDGEHAQEHLYAARQSHTQSMCWLAPFFPFNVRSSILLLARQQRGQFADF
jgi:hypothetical protein